MTRLNYYPIAITALEGAGILANIPAGAQVTTIDILAEKIEKEANEFIESIRSSVTPAVKNKEE